jgi:hypothetical protein
MSSITFQNGGQLVQLLKNGIECASKVNARPILCSLLLSMTTPGVLRIVSTDSYHMLVQDYTVPGWVDNGDFDPVMLEVSDAKAWIKAIDVKSPCTVMITERDQRVELTLTTRGAQLTAQAYDGTYPAYENLIPADKDLGKFEAAGFDGRKITVLGKIIAPGTSVKDVIPWACKLMDAMKPCIFDSAYVNLTGWHARFVIMPYRILG